MFSAPAVSYCIGGPWRALSPHVGPLLKYFSVFLALCQQPVPSRAFPSPLCPTQDVHPVRSSPVFVRQTDLNTLSVLCGFTAAAAAAAVAHCRPGVSDSLLFVQRWCPQLSESDSRIVRLLKVQPLRPPFRDSSSFSDVPNSTQSPGN